jgi:hypothetical protein
MEPETPQATLAPSAKPAHLLRVMLLTDGKMRLIHSVGQEGGES